MTYKIRNNHQYSPFCYLEDKDTKSVEERDKHMKNDLRVRYTKKVIQEAFWNLLKEKPLAKITVKEVCDLAQINRGTFYRHYMDCFDLMDKVQEDVICQMEQRLASIESKGTRSMLISLVQALQNDAERFHILYTQGHPDTFLYRIVGCCFRYMEKTHITCIPGMSQSDQFKSMNYAFLVGGGTSVIGYWIRTGMKDSPETVADQIMKLSNAFLEGLTKAGSLKKFSKL